MLQIVEKNNTMTMQSERMKNDNKVAGMMGYLFYPVLPVGVKMMADIDKRRMTNYRFYTDRKWGMAGNYTLSLNSSELGYDMCEKIIMDCATL